MLGKQKPKGEIMNQAELIEYDKINGTRSIYENVDNSFITEDEENSITDGDIKSLVKGFYL